MKLITLVIPCFNHAGFVRQCIESVIAQDYENIELIIIDDGSTDDSVAVIESLLPACRERFARFEFRSRPNMGLAATLNEALEWAQGEFFCGLGSDDILLPQKITRLLPLLQADATLAGVFSGAEAIDAHGAVLGMENSASGCYGFNEVILHRHRISTVGQLLRTALVRQVGGYRAGLYIEDWYMWLKLTEAGYLLKSLPEVLARYRYHPGNASKNRLKMFEARKIILGRFSQHPQYALALAYMCVWAAIDFSGLSKRQSFGYLADAVASCWRVVFTRYFVKGVLFWLLPARLTRRPVHAQC